MKMTASKLFFVSMLCPLSLLPQVLLPQQPVMAEEPPPVTGSSVVVESRAHYSFTSSHPESVHSGASQSVRLEYTRPNIVESEDDPVSVAIPLLEVQPSESQMPEAAVRSSGR